MIVTWSLPEGLPRFNLSICSLKFASLSSIVMVYVGCGSLARNRSKVVLLRVTSAGWLLARDDMATDIPLSVMHTTNFLHLYFRYGMKTFGSGCPLGAVFFFWEWVKYDEIDKIFNKGRKDFSYNCFSVNISAPWVCFYPFWNVGDADKKFFIAILRFSNGTKTFGSGHLLGPVIS